MPSHDAIGRVLGMFDPDEHERMFAGWVASLAGAVKGVVAIDGKTVRRAIGRGDNRSFVHMVSAFADAKSLVLGQVKVEEKSNEITAIPRLLELLHLKGAIVTIDAAGCQTAIADKIVERGENYALAVKNNQRTRFEDIDIAFHDVDITGQGEFMSQVETEAVAHGRGEYRRCETLDVSNVRSHPEKWTAVEVRRPKSRLTRGYTSARSTGSMRRRLSPSRGSTGAWRTNYTGCSMSHFGKTNPAFMRPTPRRILSSSDTWH